MRRKYRNGKIKIKLGRKRLSYRQVVKRFGLKKGASVWRGAAKYHGGTLVSQACGKRRRRKGKSRRRKSSSRRRSHVRHRRGHKGGKKFIRMGGHKVSWKGLVRKKGVKGAVKIWRKHRKV